MRIEISCSACGGNRFSFPEEGGDEAVVRCDECGHFVGTLRSMKEGVERAVLGTGRMRGGVSAGG